MKEFLINNYTSLILEIRDKDYQGSLNEKHKKLREIDKYNIFDHFELNEELLEYLDQIKDKYDLYIFTTGSMHSEPELEIKILSIFKKVFTVSDLGLYKDNPESYKKLAILTNSKSEEILFIDDQKSNTDAAKNAGLNVIQFISNKQLFSQIRSLLE